MMASLPENMHTLCESLLWPLNVFYAQYGRELPALTPLFGEHLPEPYRELLVHERNMTPTLEAYHHSPLHIELLHKLLSAEETTREIILRTNDQQKPVEYGASRVFLKQLPPPALELIHAGHLPLGTILNTCNCTHTVEPAGFFKIKPTPFFVEIFGPLTVTSLYGRRNSLVAPDGDPIAEVCEVLPPLNGDLNSRGS